MALMLVCSVSVVCIRKRKLFKGNFMIELALSHRIIIVAVDFISVSGLIMY